MTAGFSADVRACERNPRGDAWAGKLDQRIDGLVPVGFACQQPQKQDKAIRCFYVIQVRTSRLSNDTRVGSF